MAVLAYHAITTAYELAAIHRDMTRTASPNGKEPAFFQDVLVRQQSLPGRPDNEPAEEDLEGQLQPAHRTPMPSNVSLRQP
jgi:hypothetical protein